MDVIQLREPSAKDGVKLHSLVERCCPLDPNSMYCNLLQASHFAKTGVAAESNNELVGFVSGYIVPDQPSKTWFVWQVAVDESVRGRGLAKRMVNHVLDRLKPTGVQFLETTITKDNQASWQLFRSIAKQLRAPLTSDLHFAEDKHFNHQHDSEYLVRIGPIA